MQLAGRLFVLTLALPGLAAAQAAPATPPSAGSSVLQMLAGLAVVVVTIVAALYLLKRLSAPRAGSGNLMRVVSAAAVGPRERVVVVEVGETWLVVGVAPGQVRALHTMPRAEMPASAAPPRQAAADFGAKLRQFMERKPDAN